MLELREHSRSYSLPMLKVGVCMAMRHNTPSRFVREIPQDLIEEVRLHGGLTRPLAASLGSQPLSDDSTGLSLGQPVLHPMFGEGVVLNIEGRGANARIEVNFAEGSKWLVLQYANLQAL